MRVLVVEDEKKVAAFVAQGLREQSYAVDVAPDGETALDLAAVVDYDLIILDVMLPGIDGIAVCQRLRDRKSPVPILMLTARDAVEDKVMGLDSGADDYLTKPFSFVELLARVRALIRRSQAPSGTKLVVDDLQLDPITRRVSRAGKPIHLSAREFALLEYLMRHAYQVIPRTVLMEHVWEFDFEGGTNVLEVYVNYLRNKVDRNFEKRLLHTVRGVGYCLGNEDAL